MRNNSTTRLRTSFARSLDQLVRWKARHGRSCNAFQLCGCLGVILASALAIALTIYLDLSPVVTILIVLAAILTFLGLVLVTKFISGKEQIIYYHHEIAVILISSLLLLVLSTPVLAYLDVTVLGIGTFLAFGRVGCFMVGCCHGRPYRWGVSYRQEHARAGFTPYYVGVRLFPIQLVESIWVLGTVIVGSCLVISGQQPGSVLAWYVVTYDLGRFWFEFMRGDPARPYLFGFSQPQWISVVLLWCVGVAELEGILPLHWWHVAVALGLTIAMIAIARGRRFQRLPKFHLLHPRHVREIAEMIGPINQHVESSRFRWTIFEIPTSTRCQIRGGCTSLGIRLSASTTRLGGEAIEHFAFSQVDAAMSAYAARTLAQIITRLRRSESAGQLVRGNGGVFHLLIRHAA